MNQAPKHLAICTGYRGHASGPHFAGPAAIDVLMLGPRRTPVMLLSDETDEIDETDETDVTDLPAGSNPDVTEGAATLGGGNVMEMAETGVIQKVVDDRTVARAKGPSARQGAPLEPLSAKALEMLAGRFESAEASRQFALLAKGQGNDFYAKGEYQSAEKCYTLALETAGATIKGDWLSEHMKPHAEGRDLLADKTLLLPASDIAACYSNRAACHLALHAFVAAEFDATLALELRPEYAKALFRRGLAREALGEYTRAGDDMRRVLVLDPSVKDAEQAIPRLDKLALKKKEERMMATPTPPPSMSSPLVTTEPLKIADFDPKQPVLAQVLANRKALLTIHQSGQLAARHIADYKKFLSSFTRRLNEQQPEIERRTMRLKAKQAAQGNRHTADYEHAVRKQQAIIEQWNQEKHIFEKELAWLVALPAYQHTQAIVKNKFRVDSSGEFYDVEEFEAEQEEIFGGSFEDMCRKMELEDKDRAQKKKLGGQGAGHGAPDPEFL